MASEIEWTDETWNPVVGCSRVSAGCEHCYAQRFASRGLRPEHQGLTVAGPKGPRWTGELRCLPERLEIPLDWRKSRRVFVCSMSDLFHEKIPDTFIDRVFATMAVTPEHTYQILTKRPERAREWFARDWTATVRCIEVVKDGDKLWTTQTIGETLWPLPNVWLGASCENQVTLDGRIVHLLKTPAAVRFLSLEPLLGEINVGYCDSDGASFLDALRGYHHVDGKNEPFQTPKIDWVIVGGESGPGARPCDVEWIRSIVEQCREAGVAAFVKQLGAFPIVGSGEKTDAYTPSGDYRPAHPGAWNDPQWWPPELQVQEMPA